MRLKGGWGFRLFISLCVLGCFEPVVAQPGLPLPVPITHLVALPVPPTADVSSAVLPARLHATWLWQRHVDAGAKHPFKAVGDAHAVYVNDAHGGLWAVHRKNGRPLWHRHVDAAGKVGLALTPCALMLGGGAAKLQAFAPQDGHALWQQVLSSVALRPPAVWGDHAYLASLDGNVYALASCSGHLAWVRHHAVPEQVVWETPAPAVQPDGLASGFSDGYVALYDRSTGAQRWMKALVFSAHKVLGVTAPQGLFLDDFDAPASPEWVRTSLDGRALYAWSSEGVLQSYALKAGLPLWQDQVSKHGVWAQDADTLYLLDAEGTLWAYAKGSGLILWHQTEGKAGVWQSLAASFSGVLLADAQGHWCCLNPQSGAVVLQGRFHGRPLQFTPLGSDWLLHDAHGWLGLLRLSQEEVV